MWCCFTCLNQKKLILSDIFLEIKELNIYKKVLLLLVVVESSVEKWRSRSEKKHTGFRSERNKKFNFLKNKIENTLHLDSF